MKKFITPFALLTLVAALIYGITARGNKTQETLETYVKPLTVLKTTHGVEGYRIMDGEALKFLTYPGHATGWGGPMTVAPILTPDLALEDVIVTEHRETPTFFDALVAHDFFAQFKGKRPTDQLSVGATIDAVSGATISSSAVTRAVRSGMVVAAHEISGIEIPAQAMPLTLGRDAWLLLALYGAVVACSLLKIKGARLPMLAISFLFLGLMMKRPVSVSNIAALIMGHAPSPGEDLFWWLLVPGSLALVAVLGKNVYCTWLCPFGALQEFITRTGGMHLAPPKRFRPIFKASAKAIAWVALLVAFVSGNAAHAAIEPFATLFGLKGSPFRWYLLSFVMGGALFFPRFWCRFFCPAGVCFNQASKVRRLAGKGIQIVPPAARPGAKLLPHLKGRV